VKLEHDSSMEMDPNIPIPSIERKEDFHQALACILAPSSAVHLLQWSEVCLILLLGIPTSSQNVIIPGGRDPNRFSNDQGAHLRGLVAAAQP
jgi:hypothetical protein